VSNAERAQPTHPFLVRIALDQGGNAMSSPVVLITGALTGIGRAAAVVFAQEGARVVVSGRRDKQGQELSLIHI